MNYTIDWIIHSSKPLLHFWTDKKELFPWFHISSDSEPQFPSWTLYNYFVYKFDFYCAHNWEKFEYLWNQTRDLRILIQDNLEIELSIYSLMHDTSVISWIRGIPKECNQGIQFYGLRTNFNKNFCWNYHVQKKFLKEPGEFYGYKFRVSNLEITPTTSTGFNYFDLFFNKTFSINLHNEEILTQINYYYHGLFLENHWLLSDAFNYFYKIIEIEENKIIAKDYIKKDDLKKRVEDFLETKDWIDLAEFIWELNKLKQTNAQKKREEIFKKFNLTWDIKNFKTLGSIRWKFSHGRNKIDYITSPKYIHWKNFALQIILKKITL